MSSEENYHKARHVRRRSCLPSCFSGSLVFESDGMDSTSAPGPEPDQVVVASSSSWSSFKKKKEKKKTVPAAADVPTESRPAGHGDKDRLHKSKCNKTRSKPQVQRQQQQDDSINTGSLQRISPRNDTHCRPAAPASASPRPVRIGTGTGRLSSTGPNQPTAPARETDRRLASLDPLFGLLIVALTLAVMLVCGRVCAIASLCACFYLLPLLMSAVRTTEGESRDKRDTVKIDVESAEYKKWVVLEGLLERSGRRLSGLSSAPHSNNSLVESRK